MSGLSRAVRLAAATAGVVTRARLVVGPGLARAAARLAVLALAGRRVLAESETRPALAATSARLAKNGEPAAASAR